MTVTLGWWIIPAAITLACIVWCASPRPHERQSGELDMTWWIPQAARVAASLIASLGVWLIWSLAR